MTSAAHFPGIDLLKLVSFLAVIAYHCSYALWATSNYTGVPDSAGTSLPLFMEFFARSLSFSGFTILWLSFFLMGCRTLKQLSKPWLPVGILVFWMVFNSLIRDEIPVLFTWEVYPLILLGIGTLWIADRFGRRAVLLTGAIGVLLLWIPFWQWEGKLGLSLLTEQALIGICREGLDLADWPIFPWIGLIWSGYAAGRLGEGRHHALSVFEGSIWAVLLALSLGGWGRFFHTSLGYSFACSVFRMPPQIFWSHLIWPLAVVRVSIDPRVSRFLLTSRGPRAASRLALVRHFWLAYAIHYPLAFLIAGILKALNVHFFPSALPSTFAVVLFGTEMLSRGGILLLKHFQGEVIQTATITDNRE